MRSHPFFTRWLWPLLILLLLLLMIPLLVLIGRGDAAAAPAAFCDTVTEVAKGDCEALVAFYESTGGASWTDNTNWLQSDTPCDPSNGWKGVTCDFSTPRRVNGLQLASNGLSGPLPAKLADLTGLVTLDLSVNGLTGALPRGLDDLAALSVLNLAENQLTGTIPSQLGEITTLTQLTLDSNAFSGPIPASLGDLERLTTLSLYDNELGGPIPPALGRLSKLEWLDLGNNRLGGRIPAELADASLLNTLRLESNQFLGVVPVELCGLTFLLDLTLDYNRLDITNTNGCITRNSLLAVEEWRDTQTVPPQNVSAYSFQTGEVTVEWTPVNPASGPGYYEVGIATASGGPYDFAGHTTADKGASSYTFTGLDTTQPYWFVVRTQTPAATNPNNKSDLTSVNSLEAVQGPTAITLAGFAAEETRGALLPATAVLLGLLAAGSLLAVRRRA